MYNFESIADEILEEIYQDLEQKYQSEIEIDIEDGVLQFTFEINNKKNSFVINRNSASQKIWYSSPVSKPKYYEYHQLDYSWIESSTKTNLKNDLKKDINLLFE